jgi:16S rRNA (cytidine1402-2'-O)-methyltransferase
VSAIAGVLDRLARGERVAVVTDAGMPGISDPGERLVRSAVDAGHVVEVVPGPSAAVAALVASGLPTGRYAFEGFLPRKGSGRTARLAEVAADRRTTLLYEAPHRLVRTLADLAAACGDERSVAVGRELTKLHEEVWRGSLGEAVEWVAQREPRGEVVIVLDGAPAPDAADAAAVEAAVRARLEEGASPRDAAASVAAALGVPKRQAYDTAVRLRATRPRS